MTKKQSGSDGQGDRPAKKQKRSADGGAIEVTTDMVNKWKTAMTEQHSISALKQMVSAFKAASTSEQDDAKASRYSIPSSAVYHEVLVTALNGVPKVLSFHLPVKETAAGKVRVQTDSPKFKTLSPFLKTHVASIQVLLSQLSDAANPSTHTSIVRTAAALFAPVSQASQDDSQIYWRHLGRQLCRRSDSNLCFSSSSTTDGCG